MAVASNHLLSYHTPERVTIGSGSTVSCIESHPSPAEGAPCACRMADKDHRLLYDSTKTLLQSILLSLETGDDSRWDDQTESGNACLYEMHQMSGALHRAYRSDNLNANSRAQNSIPDKLSRAIPHARIMVIAIRRRDQAKALGSCKAALAAMNGMHTAVLAVASPGLRTESKPAPIPVPPPSAATAAPRHRVADRKPSMRIRTSSAH